MLISQQQSSGGRASVRRILVAVVLVVACAIPIVQLTARDDPKSLPTVTVREQRGVYSVAARFQVPQAQALALAVLTDYEHISQFMPGVDTSIVLERAAGRVVVEQEAVSHLTMFSKRVHLVLEITEGADSTLRNTFVRLLRANDQRNRRLPAETVLRIGRGCSLPTRSV